jgi:hypothetical protein
VHTFLVLYGPHPSDNSLRKPYIVCIAAERIGAAVTEALAIEARLTGVTLRAVWWEGKHQKPAGPSNYWDGWRQATAIIRSNCHDRIGDTEDRGS